MSAIQLPAAFHTTTKSPARSEIYRHVNTADAIKRIEQFGWEIHSAQNVVPRKTKKPRKEEFVKHQVELRNPTHKPINGMVPRILFVNSHDGSSSAQCLGGLFRFVCSNGLVVGNTLGAFKLRHSGDVNEELPHMLDEIGKRVVLAQNSAERWSKINLTTARARQFAEYASLLRWGDAERFSLDSVLQVRRAEDDAGDLWSVFNRVQENTTTAGLQGVSRNARRLTSRQLQGIDSVNGYNADLWDLAEAFSH